MAFLFVLASSLFIASLIGHGIHWALHRPWAGPAYRGHMEHHVSLYPPSDMTSSQYRSARWYHNGVFLYAPAFVGLLGLVWLLVRLASLPTWIVLVFGAVMLALGAVNNWAHDSFHTQSSLFRRLGCYRLMRERHHVHHRNMRCNYGIVTSFWDRVFGTLRDSHRRRPVAAQ